MTPVSALTDVSVSTPSVEEKSAGMSVSIGKVPAYIQGGPLLKESVTYPDMQVKFETPQPEPEKKVDDKKPEKKSFPELKSIPDGRGDEKPRFLTKEERDEYKKALKENPDLQKPDELGKSSRYLEVNRQFSGVPGVEIKLEGPNLVKSGTNTLDVSVAKDSLPFDPNSMEAEYAADVAEIEKAMETILASGKPDELEAQLTPLYERLEQKFAARLERWYAVAQQGRDKLNAKWKEIGKLGYKYYAHTKDIGECTVPDKYSKIDFSGGEPRDIRDRIKLLQLKQETDSHVRMWKFFHHQITVEIPTKIRNYLAAKLRSLAEKHLIPQELKLVEGVISKLDKKLGNYDAGRNNIVLRSPKPGDAEQDRSPESLLKQAPDIPPDYDILFEFHKFTKAEYELHVKNLEKAYAVAEKNGDKEGMQILYYDYLRPLSEQKPPDATLEITVKQPDFTGVKEKDNSPTCRAAALVTSKVETDLDKENDGYYQPLPEYRKYDVVAREYGLDPNDPAALEKELDKIIQQSPDDPVKIRAFQDELAAKLDPEAKARGVDSQEIIRKYLTRACPKKVTFWMMYLNRHQKAPNKDLAWRLNKPIPAGFPPISYADLMVIDLLYHQKGYVTEEELAMIKAYLDSPAGKGFEQRWKEICDKWGVNGYSEGGFDPGVRDSTVLLQRARTQKDQQLEKPPVKVDVLMPTRDGGYYPGYTQRTRYSVPGLLETRRATWDEAKKP